MNYYPIIYTRTKYCDYFDGLHVSPDFIDKEKIYECIRIASNELKFCDEHTRIDIILSSENYYIFGHFLFTQQLIEVDESLQKYCRDEGNRRTCAFLGFAALKNETQGIPKASLFDYALIYKKYIVPIWEDTLPIQSSIIPDDVVLNDISFTPFVIKCDYIYNNCGLFVDKGQKQIEEIGNDLLYIAKHSKSNIAYCSIISELSVFQEDVLTYAITTSSMISKIKYYEEQIAIERYKEAQRQKNVFQKLIEQIQRIFCRSRKK